MRWHLALTLAFSLTLGAGAAYAAYDLGSLAMLSTSVVKARRLGSTPSDQDPARVTRYRIVEVFAGPLHTGETISVSDGEYPLPDPMSPAREGPLGADLFLFLEAPP